MHRWVVAGLVCLLGSSGALAGDCTCGNDAYLAVLEGKDAGECSADAPAALDCMEFFWDGFAMGDALANQQRSLEAVVKVAESDDALAAPAANRLFRSRAYAASDEAVLGRIQAVMSKAEQSDRWMRYSKAAKGDKASLTSVVYEYCSDEATVVELIREVAVDFTTFTPLPEGMDVAKAREALSCEYMKDWLPTLAIQSLDSEYSAESYQILDDAQLELIHQAVYARRGKMITNPDLLEYFAKQYWYKPEAAYTDEALTEADKANLAHITAEKAARAQ